jgi:hypothetical protein
MPVTPCSTGSIRSTASSTRSSVPPRPA